jgi:hypothetical protein
VEGFFCEIRNPKLCVNARLYSSTVILNDLCQMKCYIYPYKCSAIFCVMILYKEFPTCTSVAFPLLNIRY